jgi:hypothetical protein
MSPMVQTTASGTFCFGSLHCSIVHQNKYPNSFRQSHNAYKKTTDTVQGTLRAFDMIFDFFIQQCILLLTHFLSPREQPISPSKTASKPSHQRPSNASAALFTSTSTSTHRAPARARTAASSPAYNSALYRAMSCARPGLVEWEKNSEIMEKGKREQKACVRVCESVLMCVYTETLRAAAGPRRRMEKGQARLHGHDVRRSEKNGPGNMGI